MMKRKRMSVYEFKEFLLECKPLWILYDSELQDRYDPASPVNARLVFSKINVELYPGTIYLMNEGNGSMVFPHPDYILIENRTYYGMTMVRIVSHKYSCAQIQDVVLALLDV